MICTHCNADVHPVHEISLGGGISESCPACGGQFAPRAAVTPAPRSEPPVAVATDAADPIGALRSRLAAVEAMIPTPERLRALKAERRQLRAALRALGAADSPN